MLRALVLIAATFFSLPALAQGIEEMAGQMILIGFSGQSPGAAGVVAAREDIAAGRAGGVMYLRANVASLDAVAEMNRQFRDAAPGLPPFIALDQEGGSIERLTAAVGFEEIPSAADMARRHDAARAGEIYLRMAASLQALGFTVNFGPVVDLDLNRANPIIARYGRAFAADSETVERYAATFVAAHRIAGVVTALKHFPGHGSSTTDSHDGFTDITAVWREEELAPYRALIASGLADMVMVGHLYHASYDSEGAELPSSLNGEWIEGVLRGTLGFDGVVISDDLEMGAIRQHFGLRETVVRAVRAGMDVLLFSNTADYRPGLAAEVQAILIEEAEADPAFRARIEESYARIAALKQRVFVQG